jgi:hypothetical protein
MSNKLETRFITQEFRVSSEGESPKIAGYAAVFNTNSDLLGGWFVETIDPHAFDGVIARNPDCRALWNHNPDVVLGRTTSGTLKLSIDDHGLAYEINPPDTTTAKDLMTSMRRKDVTQSSFQFSVRKDEWTDNADGSVARRILEIEDLVDVSPVTYPAYPTASSTVRSIPESCPMEIRSRFESNTEAKAEVKPEEKRDDGDDATEVCLCDCTQCVGGDCGICSDMDCDEVACSCSQSEGRAWKETYELRIRLAQKLAK